MKSQLTVIARLATALVASAAMLAPSFAFAAVTIGVGITIGSGTAGNNIGTVAGTVLGIINNILVPVLFALAFILFLYGVAKAYIFSGGDSESVSQGHRLILWGIIAFVVMISLWGLVNVVANTFGLQGYGAPVTPVSYPT